MASRLICSICWHKYLTSRWQKYATIVLAEEIWDAVICIQLFCCLAQPRPFFSSNQLQTCSGLLYNYTRILLFMLLLLVHMSEYWVKAKVARFSISRLEFSLLYLPHTFDSFYTLPHQRYLSSSFFHGTAPLKVFQSIESKFYFHRKQRFKTKTRKPI